MANARIGSNPSHGYQVAQTIDDTLQLGLGDSGKLFFLKSHNDYHYNVNLPKLSAEIAGWHCKFIANEAISNEISILGWGLPVTGGNSSTTPTADHDQICKLGFITQVGDGDTTDQLDTDGLKWVSGATLGDTIEFFTDGITWFAYIHAAEEDHITNIDLS